MSKASPRPTLALAASFIALQIGALAPALAASDATFSITIESAATDKTLKLPDGNTVGAPIAPGAYAVVENGTFVFDADKTAADGLESLAEDGNPEPFIAKLRGMKGVREAGLFVPGQPFDVTAKPSERLLFASMFVQSNDLFLAPDPKGIALFDEAAMKKSGDVTDTVMLWDAGTEVNETPGTGPNQAPRQATPDYGPVEGGVVHPVSDSFAYPAVVEVIRVTVHAR